MVACDRMPIREVAPCRSHAGVTCRGPTSFSLNQTVAPRETNRSHNSRAGAVPVVPWVTENEVATLRVATRLHLGVSGEWLDRAPLGRGCMRQTPSAQLTRPPAAGRPASTGRVPRGRAVVGRVRGPATVHGAVGAAAPRVTADRCCALGHESPPVRAGFPLAGVLRHSPGGGLVVVVGTRQPEASCQHPIVCRHDGGDQIVDGWDPSGRYSSSIGSVRSRRGRSPSSVG